MTFILGKSQQKLISINVKMNQLRFRGKINSPFLSGDGFAGLCDLIFPSKEFDDIRVSRAQSIFCQSDFLEEFLERYRYAIKAQTLILGNSDRDFYEFNHDLPTSVTKVLLQNSHLSGTKFQVLPIGIENLSLGRNGLTKYFPEEAYLSLKSNGILVGPFSPTHVERHELLGWKDIKDANLKYIEHYLPPSKLSVLASQYRFIACPRGNGTDTHRFWETLYRGSIPVVKKSQWSHSISNLGFPVIQLNEWSYEEFQELSKSGDFQSFNPKMMPTLWLSYWDLIINSNP